MTGSTQRFTAGKSASVSSAAMDVVQKAKVKSIRLKRLPR